jgi:hypothetical protein
VLSDTPLHPKDTSKEAGYEGYVVAETVMASNGYLIAAAPELLAAAKLVITYFDMVVASGGYLMQEAREAWVALDAAIRKAERT